MPSAHKLLRICGFVALALAVASPLIQLIAVLLTGAVSFGGGLAWWLTSSVTFSRDCLLVAAVAFGFDHVGRLLSQRLAGETPPAGQSPAATPYTQRRTADERFPN